MKSKLIKCSSNLRSSGTNGKWKINLPSQAGEIDNVKGMCTRFIQFPNLIKNVNETNNTIRVIKTTGNVIYDVAIPIGQYTVSQLAQQLQNFISTAINPDSVGVVVATLQDSSTILRFTWVGDTYTIDYNNTTLRNVIGLTETIGPAAFYNLQSEVNLTGVNAVYIHSRLISSGNTVLPELNISLFDVVDLSTTPYGAIATLDVDDPEVHTITYEDEIPRSYKFLEFVVRDSDGNVLTVPNNFRVELFLKVFY
jgi:hypothetical protein